VTARRIARTDRTALLKDVGQNILKCPTPAHGWYLGRSLKPDNLSLDKDIRSEEMSDVDANRGNTS